MFRAGLDTLAICAVIFALVSWIYVRSTYQEGTVILTLEEHRLQRDTMHRALAEVQRLRADLEACQQAAPR